MARFLISDHHFGHANIIEYCDRPFSSVGEMDTTLLNRHYETVDAGDLVVHLGDVAMDMSTGEDTIEYFGQLGADLLVRGNHDVGLDPENAPFPVVDHCTLSHDGYEFYCTHRPTDVPDEWDGWVLHGHHHNNDTETYPFVAHDRRRVNVSSELLNFRPVRLDALTDLLEACPDGSRFRDVDAANGYLDHEA